MRKDVTASNTQRYYVRLRDVTSETDTNGDTLIGIPAASLSPEADEMIRGLFPRFQQQVRNILADEILFDSIVRE